MKKIVAIIILIIVSQGIVHAQNHAAKPYSTQIKPGLYPEGSSQLLRPANMEGLTSWDLKVMRNEIFARHGYIFKSQDLADYFEQQSWYVPKYNEVTGLLSSVEKKNILFIKKYE